MNNRGRSTIDACKVSDLIKHFETLNKNHSNQQQSNYSENGSEIHDAKKIRYKRRRSISSSILNRPKFAFLEEFERKVYLRNSLPAMNQMAGISENKSMSEVRESAQNVQHRYESLFREDENVQEIGSHLVEESRTEENPERNINDSEIMEDLFESHSLEDAPLNYSQCEKSAENEDNLEQHIIIPIDTTTKPDTKNLSLNESHDLSDFVIVDTHETEQVLNSIVEDDEFNSSVETFIVPDIENSTSDQNDDTTELSLTDASFLDIIKSPPENSNTNEKSDSCCCKRDNASTPKSSSKTLQDYFGSNDSHNFDDSFDALENYSVVNISEQPTDLNHQKFNQLKFHTDLGSFEDPQKRCSNCVFDDKAFKYTCNGGEVTNVTATAPKEDTEMQALEEVVDEPLKIRSDKPLKRKSVENYRIDSSYFSNDEEDYDDCSSFENDYVMLRPRDSTASRTSGEEENEQENDLGYCTLRPISSTCRQINGSREMPIYEDLKILSKVDNGNSKDSSALSLYKELTILDADKNVRIKTVSKIPVDCVNPIIVVSPSKEQKEYIIDELINTENNYIQSLDFVIKSYLVYFSELFINEPRRYKHIFANIEHIYEESVLFLKDLELCKYDCDEIAGVFLKHETLFNLYPTYCKNKKTSSDLILGDFREIVSKRDIEVDDGLGLISHLLRPIQRLAKYELLLEKLLKCRKGDDTTIIERAIALVQNVARAGNDLIILEAIENNPFTLEDTGRFLIKDYFKMISPQKMEVVLFLFKHMIIFAVKTMRDIDTYAYRTHIEIKSLSRMTDDSLLLSLEDFFMRKKHKDPKFVLEAKDMKLKNKWIKKIDEMLWEQLQECKDKVVRQHSNVDPIPIPVDKPAIENYTFPLYPRERMKKSHFFVSLKR